MCSFTDLLRRQGKATDKQTAHSYGPLYDRWLTPLVDRPARLLEIGVSMFGGGDLLAFAEFLPLAEIHGIDRGFEQVLPAVTAHPRIVLHEGDAYNGKMLHKLAGPDVPLILTALWDVIIDDCEHCRQSQKAAFLLYWPMVAIGGQYIIEDIQASYATEFREWLQAVAGPGSCVEVHDLTHERNGDNIIARIVRGETGSPN